MSVFNYTIPGSTINSGCVCTRENCFGCETYEKFKEFALPLRTNFDRIIHEFTLPLRTNFDRIIHKTPYELSEWLADILTHCGNKAPGVECHDSCPLYKCCNDGPDNIEDWLNAPADKEGET